MGKFKRVLLKLSGEALMGKEKTSKVLDKDVLFRIASQVKALVEEKIDVCIVIGGGNIFRGKYCEELSIERSSADYMGMVATIFNSLAFKASLDAIGVDNVVMSALNINQVCEPYYYLKARRHLEKGRVVIFAAGTGNPFFTTDTLPDTSVTVIVLYPFFDLVTNTKEDATINITANKAENIMIFFFKSFDFIAYLLLNYSDILYSYITILLFSFGLLA